VYINEKAILKRVAFFYLKHVPAVRCIFSGSAALCRKRMPLPSGLAFWVHNMIIVLKQNGL